MATITTRSGKGSPLTNNEVDANFTNLNTDKAELSGAAFTGAITTNSTFDGRDVATDGTKLDGIEASADVTDTANVTAAGALMDSELTSIASVKALNQGVATTDSPTFVDVTATSLDISGNIDVDGTTNLDVVDIDGAVDMASTLAVGGVVTANAGVVVDNFTLDGTTLALSSGDMTLDVAGDIILDADGGDLIFKDGGALRGSLKAGTNAAFELKTLENNADFKIKGTDNNAEITALTLSMGAAGAATFNSTVTSTGLTVQPDTGATTALLTLNNGNGSGTLSQINLGYTGDPDHGNISYTGDMIFTAGATERMRIDSSGNLGIGTTSPEKAIHVKTAVNNTAVVRIESTAANSYPTLSLKNDAREYQLTAHGPLGDKFTIYDGTAGSHRFVIDSAGQVGIGTSSPSSFSSNANNLVVGSGSGTEGITINSGSANYGTIYFADGTSGSAAYAGNINYNHADNSMRLGTNGSTTNVVIDSTGRVGIGTSSPNAGSSGTQHSVLTVKGSGSLGNGILELIQKGTTGNNQTLGDIKFFDNTNHNVSIEALRATSTDSGTLAFKTRAASGSLTERMRIDSAGNVGIGITPSYQLDVYDTAAAFAAKIKNFNGSDAGGGLWIDTRWNTAANRPLKITSNNEGTSLFEVTGLGNVGIGTSSPTEKLHVNSGTGNVPALFQSSDSLALITFKDNNTNTDVGVGAAGNDQVFYAGTERMRIDSAGNVGIGTSNPSAKLGINATAPDFTLLQSNAVKYRMGVSNVTNGGVTGSASGDYFARTSGGKMLFSTNDGVTAHAVIDSAGNVGIGTSSPNFSGFGSSTGGIDITNTTNAALRLDGNAAEAMFIVSGSGQHWFYGKGAVPMTFSTNGTERMRIDSSGNLLVGTTSNSVYNDVSGTGIALNAGEIQIAGTGTPLYLNRQGSDGTLAEFRKSGSSFGLIGVANGDNLYIATDDTNDVGLKFNGDGNRITPCDASGADRGSAIDLGESGSGLFKDLYLSGGVYANNASGAFLWNAENAHIAFGTNNTERMRIDSSGNLLVGKTSTNVNVAGGYINGGEAIMSISSGANTYLVRNTSTSTYSFYVSGAGQIHAVQTSISSLSDKRLKENIVDIDTGLAEVIALKPRKFDWKEGEGSGEKNVTGFIAQEVETVLPELIGDFEHDDLNDAKSVKMGDMVPTLVKAIQEQQTLIESLTARITALENA